MFGPPKDVPGECNARLSIGDDYGDNAASRHTRTRQPQRMRHTPRKGRP
jgi:hypothetical protein